MKKNNEEGLFRQVRPKILLIMKLTTAFLLMSFLSVSAATLGQRATIKVTNVTLKSVFKEVKQKMGYTFVYNEHDVNQVGKVTLDITTSDVKQVLDKCLENTALGYCIQGDVVVIQKRAEQIVRDVEKESFKITGLVQDKKKEPLPGVTVLLKGTSVGVATDKDGKFSLEVPQMDSVVLVFSFVGMKDKEIAIKKLEKEMKPLTVVMEEDEEELSEVVVTGMFNRRKEGFTGSAVSVKGEDLKKWKFQTYLKNYLRVVRSVDDQVGRVVEYLKKNGLYENTIIVYMGDQGFFLGEHGLYDKRWMYEESLQMPCLISYPGHIPEGQRLKNLTLNVDIAPTLLNYAGVKIPSDMQGVSMKGLLEGDKSVEKNWRKSAYYQYFEYPKWHNVQPHYGVRTDRYKLIHFYYNIDQWEFYDMQADPNELTNQYDNPAYAKIIRELKKEIVKLQKEYNDTMSLEERRKLTDKYMLKYEE